MDTVNLVDLLLLVALVSAAVRGAQHGALSQVVAFGGAAAGLLAGSLWAPALASRLVQGPSTQLALLTLALVVGSVLVGQTIGLALGARLRAAVHGAGAGPADRAGGVLVGVAGLLAVAWLLGSALQQGPLPALARQVQQSRILSAVAEALPPAPDLVSRVGAYLDRQGFPQVFSSLESGVVGPPVEAPNSDAVAAAQAAGQASTVQVLTLGCGGVSSGSGFVSQPGLVVTNAHVIAGGESISVRDASGAHAAEPLLVDTELDLAVLRVPTVQAPPIPFADTAPDRGGQGATLGFSLGQAQLQVKPAAVRQRITAVGRDIYGSGLVRRDVLTLDADVVQGDSGGPFVTADGLVGGVVFAAATGQPDIGYALAADFVADDVAAAAARSDVVSTGACRY